MIIVTGGAGFIGSALVWGLNQKGRDDILIADHLGQSTKWKNLNQLKFKDYLEKDQLINYLEKELPGPSIDGILHMGACSSTTEGDVSYLIHNNTEFSKKLMRLALTHKKRFVYASSAATYGNGQQGFSDSCDPSTLIPLNPYGFSKQRFDLYLRAQGMNHNALGLKFFNVYGPNEYHKGEMRSVVIKTWEQIKQTGEMKLFRSYRPEYPDGGQQRDFVYIKDVVDLTLKLYFNTHANGLLNIGTGYASSFNDLSRAVFNSLELPPRIDFIDMPESIRHQYQYYTKADMKQCFLTLKNEKPEIYPRYTLEKGIEDYVRNYLETDNPYLGNS